MSFAISLVVIIVIGSLFGTVLVARNVEENYGKSTKRNVKNLSTIYIILLFVLLLGVTWYAVII
ncbi:cytochrome c biogenesis protein ResB [Bacillus cereus]|uniref:cytochrome c biogenesis protein ResB n=1 Tax=Bacillus cereus group sp. BfR-BA-01453 TaxID=2920355 RepID=UPI001F58EEAA|nr:cytochrome c biogenesis protein ResB [Bacillus cereus group sp. BfR-BA-01453]